MARKHMWEMTIKDAALIILEKAQGKLFHYVEITREIQRRWPNLIPSNTPENSVDRALRQLVLQGLAKTPRNGSGLFQIAEKRFRYHQTPLIAA